MTLLNQVAEQLKALAQSERGANLVEYGMLVAFIAIVVILAVTTVGQEALSNIDVGSQIRPP
ncbi:MAG: Flp family type IVb pilin [Acidimicrobiia bacterium]|nr:Flp family type IVb pilin [Acidimicrobiia bacterium]